MVGHFEGSFLRVMHGGPFEGREVLRVMHSGSFEGSFLRVMDGPFEGSFTRNAR